MNPWNRQSAAVQSQATAEVDTGLRSYMLRVYNYMTSGILLTAIVAYFAGTSPAFQQALVGVGPDGQAHLSPLFWIVALAPAAMGFFVMPRMYRMSESGAKAAFWGYAFLMGLALWSIFAVYTQESIFRVLLVTSGTFGLLSILGYTTKKDLTGMGTFLGVGVLAVFIVTLLNAFWFHSMGLDLIMSYIGVAIAVGLTAYYTQRTKEVYYAMGRNAASGRAAIIGAMNLYFAFVYLFINLMRIMGNRR